MKLRTVISVDYNLYVLVLMLSIQLLYVLHFSIYNLQLISIIIDDLYMTHILK